MGESFVTMSHERYIKFVVAVYVLVVFNSVKSAISSESVLENEIPQYHFPVCDKSVKARNDKEFRIAWFAPAKEYYNFSASSSVGAMKLALNQIENEELLYGYNVNIKWYDSDCNSKSALAAAVDARTYFDPDVFIGPPCSNGLLGVAQLGSHWNLPVFSWVSDHIDFNDTGKFNTLIRLAGPLSSISESFRVFPKYFSWERFSLIYDKQTPYETVATALREPKENYTIYSTHDISAGSTHPEIESILLQVKKYSRIIIFVVPWFDLRRYLLVAHELGMANGEYAFICIHGDRFTWDVLDEKVFSDWGWRRNDTDDARAREIYESVIHIMMDPLPRETLSRFHKGATDYASVNAPYWDLPVGVSSDAYAPYLFDTMMVWAKAVNLTVAMNGNPRDGALIYKNVPEATNTKWVTGVIVFGYKNSRDRKFNFIVLDMAANGTFYSLFNFEYRKDSMKVTYDDKVAFLKRGHWPTKDRNPPSDVPACGFDGEKCVIEKSDETYIGTIIGASVSASIVLTLAIVVHLMLRRYRRQQLLQSMLWQVKFEEIDFVTAWITGSIRNSFKNLQKRRTSGKAARKAQYKGHYSVTVLKDKNQKDCSPETVQKSLDPGTMFGHVAFVRGNLTSVKRIQKLSLNLTKDVILELNQLMELKHQNTCAFVGAYLEPTRAILLWEYCSKGSLQDVIWNQNIKLDQLFMYALCLDAAKGLEFIHKSSVHYHGNLKSTNCVVDSRWTLKLADFGVQKIRELEKLAYQQNNETIRDEKLLWAAPECLKDRKDTDRQKADIYALGIIIKEVFTRSGPYSDYPFLMAHEILAKIKDHDPGCRLFRPMIPQELKQNTELTTLIEDCWSEEPSNRPSAQRVVKTLNRVNPSKNVSMIDNMIAMLEKYANHLEELVAERTSELDAEKKKTENLLYRMLPQTVAEELKLGRPIKAEDFDEATIYFSDIVGFTNICASSTPIEVVNLLNSLYTLFDDIITRYDIYKVETIGDAYMIASGLPKRNGKRHTKEIADCALDIMASVFNFCIPHQPDRKVKIRIGIHTGPVVAGVVGLAMPRYCLFGDTVNTASRMESTGLPLRIHLSQRTKEALDRYEGYIYFSRGEISVKGKGVMNTYFLRGREGFKKELPKWDEEVQKDPVGQRPSVASINSVGSSGNYGTSMMSPSSSSSMTLSDIWDERYKSKQTSILEITCL